MISCAKLLLLSSVTLVAAGGAPTYEDFVEMDRASAPITTQDFDALRFGKVWQCTARSRVTRTPFTDPYVLKFGPGDGNPTGLFQQSGLTSTYEVKDGELRRVTQGARLERMHRNQPFDKFEMNQCATCDLTTIPHTEVVRRTKDGLLIRMMFNPALEAPVPQAYLACTPM